MTVIYYTSNCEDEAFENKIRNTLVKNCSLPIISVSQKPIELGTNICVGEHEASVYNSKKQIYEGLKRATTKFICMAEADFLYPPEYFEFEPKEDIFYCIKNVYILWRRLGSFRRKYGSEGATICHRERLMEYMETYLTDRWDEDIKMGSILSHPLRKWVWFDNPVVTFKTGNGMHLRCPYHRGSKCREITYWGSAKNLKNVYF